MNLEIREVVSSSELRTFIFLPKKIHRHDHAWLPPLWSDEKVLFNKEKNHSFEFADTVMLMAWRGGKAVGRIMGLISHRYNKINNENSGRFCFLECDNDREVVHELITAVEEWARKKGMSALVGPLGFSDKDPQGFQIEGFDLPQIMTTTTNLPYLPELIADEGYVKKKDILNYHAPIPDHLPELYTKIFARVSQRQSLKIIEFKTKNEIKPYIVDVLELMNETFAEIYGFVPLTKEEKIEFANRYLPLIDPEFIKVVSNGSGELVGFAIGMPDLSPGIKRSRGYLFPIGIFHILRSAATSKKLMMMLGGVKAGYRGQGIDTLMGAKILESAKRKNMTILDSHLVLEENQPMRSEYERIGGKIVKRFRIFTKDL
ncbi:MAG TPA: hypothetical protein VMV74_10410 [Bacteroidales bacterium]|nr:hypothetical protein [Bacteroidales bacterium]